MRNELRGIVGCEASSWFHTRRVVGGKGHNLYQLRRAGYRVPRWLVIASWVFDEALGGVRDHVDELLAGIDFGDAASVRTMAQGVRDLVVGCPVPDRTMLRIERLIDTYFDSGALLAVRSSVRDEDDPEASFAGQMDTVLNIDRARVLTAIKQVWASAFSARSLLYRHERGLSHDNVSVAVIIQEMIQSHAAGVMFTRDPLSMERVIVVSAARGSGEGVVQGTAAVQNYRLSECDGRARSVKNANQFVPLLSVGPVGSQPDAGSESLLSRHQLMRLQDVGRGIEACFGRPQDIEWAIDGRGLLYLLQSRPMTGTAARREQHTCVWDNANIVENYPGLTLPLTFSFVRDCYELSVRQATLGCLLWRRELDSELSIFGVMIGLLRGRVYYRLLNWYQLLSYLPGFSKHQQAWDQMIGINRQSRVKARRLSLVNRAYASANLILRLIAVRWNCQRFLRDFAQTYDRYRDCDLSRRSEDEIIDLFESMKRDFTRRWHLTLYNDFSAMKYYEWLRKLCLAWAPGAGGNLHNDLLCGVKTVESVRPVQSVLRLVGAVRSDARLRSLFENNDDSTVWRVIQADGRFGSFAHDVQAHIDQFGDRALEELKLESRTFRDCPQSVIALIREYLRLGLTCEAVTRREAIVRSKAEEALRLHLHGPFRGVLVRFVLNRARQAVAGRENMRFARTRLFGLVRRLFDRLGARFVELKLLRQAEDLHYLTVNEVFDYIRGTSATLDIQALADLRRYEYESFAEEQLAGRIVTCGVPYRQFEELCSSPPHDHALRGVGCSSGIVEGSAWVVDDPGQLPPGDDCVLVARSTDPGWIFLMIRALGIIVERGSLLSHAAIVGRELGIPTVVGVEGATQAISTGCRVRMNGETGEVVCLS